MNLTLRGDITPSFAAMVEEVLTQLHASAEVAVLPLMRSVNWEIWPAPEQQHFDSLQEPPPDNHTLAGLYFEARGLSPPRILLFERSIRGDAIIKGVSVRTAVRDTAVHELAEHRFGLNHVEDRAAAMTTVAGHDP